MGKGVYLVIFLVVEMGRYKWIDTNWGKGTKGDQLQKVAKCVQKLNDLMKAMDEVEPGY